MYNDIFVLYFIPTVNSNPHCDTSFFGPMPPICNSVSACLPGQAGKLWGRQKPSGASRAQQSGLPEPGRASPPAAGWNVRQTAELPCRDKNTGARQGESLQWDYSPTRPGSASYPQTLLCYRLGGGGHTICGGFTVLPNLLRP